MIMKKILVLIAAILLSTGLYAQNARAIYNKYSNEKGISAVYISPSMFKLIGAIPNLEVPVDDKEKVDISPLVKSLSGFYLLSTEDRALADKISSEAERYIRSGKFELMMEAKEDGEAVRIYTVSDKDIITGLVMTAKDGEEMSFICLDGIMNKKDLEGLIAKVAK